MSEEKQALITAVARMQEVLEAAKKLGKKEGEGEAVKEESEKV